ncbi:MAG: YicC family protein [Desulfovibrio sp.]|nr:MAG: YicC family protein [Desulfovibrio sp.]
MNTKHRLKSMTGFGRSASETDGPNAARWSFTWELKSVNSRHLDLKWRLPMFLRCMEPGWEKVVREYGKRGRLDIFLHVRIKDPSLLNVSLNTTQAQAMITELAKFAQALNADLAQQWQPDLNRLITAPHLWEDDAGEPDSELLADLESGLRSALEDWNLSRAGEGEALHKDMAKRLIRLREWLDRIRERAPEIKENKQEALVERIRQALESAGVEPDQDRMLQETATLADRLDVSEEMTRLAAHLERFDEILDQGGEAGKRLDFTLQECFREINTLGNKCQDAQVSRLVVDFKAELEKCREQVQNLE